MAQVHISNEIDTAVIVVDKTAVETEEERADFLDYVRKDMLRTITENNPDLFRPFHIHITNIDAKYCTTDEEIDAFESKHACSRCDQVKPSAHASLLEFPDAVVVLMNIHFRKYFLNPTTP